MTFIRGESINIGVGMENPTARGTIVAPQAWIPGRVPTTIAPKIEKVTLRETRSTGVDSSGSEIIQRSVEGGLEFNVKNNSIGYLLRSLFGRVTTTVVEVGRVWSHRFELLPQNPQHPSLTLGLSQPHATIRDYNYSLAVANSLELRTPVDDLVNMTVGFIAARETVHATKFSPVFPSNDHYFRHQDVVVKVAANEAGLAAAPALRLKELSSTSDNNSRVNQNIGDLNPSDVLSNFLSMTLTLKGDYQNPADWRDLFTGGAYRAMSITMRRADIQLGTVGTQNPTIEIIFPKVSVEGWTEDRPIDDIVTEGFEVKVHYDDVTARAVQITVVNETPHYNHA